MAAPNVVVKANMMRKIEHRAIEQGLKTDHSADPIYFEQVAEMDEVLSLQGHFKESALIRFAIVVCHQACGRTAEFSWKTEAQLGWDPKLQQCFLEWKELKTSKTKLAVFTASVSRRADWFLSYFDYLASHPKATLMQADEDEPDWLFPMLQGTGAGRTCGNWLKDLRDNASKYPNGRASSLP